MDIKIGGVEPATRSVTVSIPGNAGDVDYVDTSTVMPVLKRAHTTFPHQYSIQQPFAPYYATTPVDGHDWLTPQEEHTDDKPWCAIMKCRCHYEHWRMERYFIAPIEHGVLDIAQAIDLYHAEPGYMARKMEEARAREGMVMV